MARTWGEPPIFDFDALPHYELGERLGIFDFERAAKISGSRFAILRGDGARLQRALTSFMLDVAREHGYSEVAPPYLVRREAMVGHRAAAQVRGRGVPHRRRPVPHPDRRGAGHQSLRGRDSRGGAAADRARRVHAVLAARGGRRGQGHARIHPPAPVREGGDGPLHHTGDVARRARADHVARRARAAAARPALSRAAHVHRRPRASRSGRSTTSRCGRPGCGSGSRCRRARCSPTSRRDAPTSATARRRRRSRASCTRSTAARSACRARTTRCSRPISSATDRCVIPEPLRAYLGGHGTTCRVVTDDAIDPAWLNDRSAFQLNFVHGLRNPAGLHLQYELDGDRVFTDWTPGTRPRRLSRLHARRPASARCSTTRWAAARRCTGTGW